MFMDIRNWVLRFFSSEYIKELKRWPGMFGIVGMITNKYGRGTKSQIAKDSYPFGSWNKINPSERLFLNRK